jgi:hypothetical protein
MTTSTPPNRTALSTLTLCLLVISSNAFAPKNIGIIHARTHSSHACPNILFNTPENKGIIDLTDEDDSPVTTTNEPNNNMAAPFLSQGELSTDPNLLNPDFNDPKQTRVIIYIILTLVPILFLVPLMIGSRDLIPLDALPPVEIN